MDEPARGAEHRLGEVERDHARRQAGEGERRVAAARGDVEDAHGLAGAPPGQEPLEVGAPGVLRARHVRLGALAELRLDAAGLGVAHELLPRFPT